MQDRNYIDASSHIDFYYAWTPEYASLNNISKTEKVKLVKFIENGIVNLTEEKTINELHNLINFINSPPTIENIVEITHKLDGLHNTNINSLKGIDFQSMLVENNVI
jgi:hypothetical protein